MRYLIKLLLVLSTTFLLIGLCGALSIDETYIFTGNSSTFLSKTTVPHLIESVNSEGSQSLTRELKVSNTTDFSGTYLSEGPGKYAIISRGAGMLHGAKLSSATGISTVVLTSTTDTVISDYYELSGIGDIQVNEADLSGRHPDDIIYSIGKGHVNYTVQLSHQSPESSTDWLPCLTLP